MAGISVLAEARHDMKAWSSLVETAIHGLHDTYAVDKSALPHTRKWDGHNATCYGHSVRYALIALLGLAKGASVAGAQHELVRSLWKRIGANGRPSGLSAGDLGLGLWARALHGGGAEAFTVDRALRVFRRKPRACDSVDLAWLLLGAEHAVLGGLEVCAAERLAEETKHALLALYNPNTSLFFRHRRLGLANQVSRRVACFANQVYPLMALSVHTRRTGCSETGDATAAVADRLCRAQGELGQWWWLYDATLGEVVESYPVFSVHQDGMAPMALLEASAAVDRCFTESIERGLQWVFGANELNESAVLREKGLIVRDIHRRGVGRIRRMIKGTLWCCGRRTDHKDLPSSTRFDVNKECRPYHLGWILYAAGLVAGSAPEEMTH